MAGSSPFGELERHSRVRQRAFRAHEALGDGGLGHEERAGDHQAVVSPPSNRNVSATCDWERAGDDRR